MNSFRSWLSQFTPFVDSEEPASRPLEVKNINLDEISGNPYQPRSHIDEEGVEELAQSIKKFGIITPIQVTPTAESPGKKKYQLVAGERRVRACRKLGRAKIPAMVRNLSDEEIIELSFLDNLQREKMNPLDEATMYNRLRKEFKNLSIEELSNLIGKSEEKIKEYDWILDLPTIIQQAISRELIDLETAQKIKEFDEEGQKKFISYVADEDPDEELIQEKIKSLQDSQEAKKENESSDENDSVESEMGIPSELQEREL